MSLPNPLLIAWATPQPGKRFLDSRNKLTGNPQFRAAGAEVYVKEE